VSYHTTALFSVTCFRAGYTLLVLALVTGAFTRRLKTWLDAEKIFIPCCFFLQTQIYVIVHCTETQVPAGLEPTLTIFCQSLYTIWLSCQHFDLFNCQFIWWFSDLPRQC